MRWIITMYPLRGSVIESFHFILSRTSALLIKVQVNQEQFRVQFQASFTCDIDHLGLHCRHQLILYRKKKNMKPFLKIQNQI